MNLLGPILFFVFCLIPANAAAYVDPGIIATLYQVGYVLVFGILLTAVTAPFRAVKNLWRRILSMLKKDSGSTKPKS